MRLRRTSLVIATALLPAFSIASEGPRNVRTVKGMSNVAEIETMEDERLLQVYNNTIEEFPDETRFLQFSSVDKRKTIAFGKAKAFVFSMKQTTTGDPCVIVIFRQIAPETIVMEAIRTQWADLDRDVRDLDGDRIPEILVNSRVTNGYLPGASALLWPEVHRFTGKYYEKRSEEFFDFYVFKYWPKLVKQVQEQLTIPTGHDSGEDWVLPHAQGLLMAQQEILRRINAVLQEARKYIIEKRGHDPFVK